METGRIRKKRNKFSQVSNHCLRNDKLSLRAKGLYALIQSFIDIPDFTVYKSVLQNKYCNEGRDAFNKAWKDLINAGYLKVLKTNTKNGFVYEYELLDEPDSINNENNKDEEVKIENESLSLSPHTENPHMGPYTENPRVDNPDTGNAKTNNINKTNINYKNIDYFNDDKDKEIKKENEKFLTLRNDIFTKYISEYPQGVYYCLTFVEWINKNNVFLFKVCDVVHRYLAICETYRNCDFAISTLDLFNSTLETFTGKSRNEIKHLSEKDISLLFDQAYSVLSNENETIYNKQAYFSQIVRTKLKPPESTL